MKRKESFSYYLHGVLGVRVFEDKSLLDALQENYRHQVRLTERYFSSHVSDNIWLPG